MANGMGKYNALRQLKTVEIYDMHRIVNDIFFTDGWTVYNERNKTA